MLEALIRWLFKLKFHKTIQQVVLENEEKIKREWLEKGYARGLVANRPDMLFCLCLRRSDVPIEGDGVHQPGAGLATVGVPRSSTPQYAWWGTVDEKTGVETCIGDLAKFNLDAALSAYLNLLADVFDDPTMLRLLGERYWKAINKGETK